MRKIILFLFLFSFAFAQYYDIAIVRANDSTVLPALVYDDNSTSYADNSIENPDANIRICASSPSELLGKYISLCYADGYDGDYIQLTDFPIQITRVEPSGCAYIPLDISTFRAWYPSIPYVFISNSVDMSSASRWKLSRLTGWFAGNYSVNRTQSLNEVNVTVLNATDDLGTEITIDVNYLVIGLVRSDFTTMDTAISSLYENVTLFADSPTANYSIFINGIGPDVPPYVKIITPENGKEYSTSSIPFTYIMVDDDGITKCWYVLDGVKTDMPNCGPAYILTGLRDGLHTLSLYANDTTGNVAYDTVSFRVTTTTPSKPGGGGGSGIPYYQPIVPPKPPFMELTIIPKDIYIKINYDKDGKADFVLHSTIPLKDAYCYVRGDFENYTYVSLERSNFGANDSVKGSVVVSMPPTDILDYNRMKEGVLQCVGNATTTLLASTLANVYLIINKPELELLDNVSISVYQGEELNYTLKIVNHKNETEIKNLTFEIGKYQFLFIDKEISRAFSAGQEGWLRFIIKAPKDMEPGIYNIPITFYEHGRVVGQGMIKIEIMKKEIPPIPEVCKYPDLTWTMLILLIGFVLSVIVFRWKRKEETTHKKPLEGDKIEERIRNWIDLNKKPLLYAIFVMLFFIMLWLVIVISLWKCT
ncbi:MAG: hypothetical protein QXY64_01160 [Candidatus Bilamarchaeaceae archaeon]